MSWIKTFLLAFILFLLTLKTIDIAWGFISPSERVNGSVRSISLREIPPNTESYTTPTTYYLSRTENLEKKNYKYRTDSNGFILGKANSEKDSAKVDIIFFGGSTTQCILVDEDIRFPAHISDLITRKDGAPIVALNAGMGASNSMHSLISLIGKGLPKRPKYAFLMHAINDLTLLELVPSYWDAPTDRALVVSGQREDFGFKYFSFNFIKQVLIPNTWPEYKYIISNIASKYNVNLDHKKYKLSSRNYIEIRRSVHDQFKKSLISFVEISRAWGIEPVLMTQFNRIHMGDKFIQEVYEKDSQTGINWDDFVSLYAVMNEITREVAREKKVTLIDLDKEIPSNSKYIYDAVHLNGEGSKLVGKVIARRLSERYQKDFSLSAQ
ncbi:SGNH/GDSL hydrolase family protein [Polynucleobacter sp. VK25]|uniref:SGNH/GDSL hydrolase family protein n=1 Tax=Polynucleobacter sp. VK25 TaxID=1758398 RepID=UPI001BFDD93D|nr:SGNH/GDSL hydrolase family protein [Polynucleobacter sp. VK25]QWD68648.1 SGNH/GDSL hydrolase family protein [Polynucleobacter sp. VK25]